MIDVIGLKRLGAFRLRVEIPDGPDGDRDFPALVAEPEARLDASRDAACFDRVFPDFGAPTRPGGFDIAPEWLRRDVAAAGELRRTAAA